MTDSEITTLLAKRDKLLTRRDGLYDHDVVASIEAKLAEVEPGKRNDVDLALGRMCATLEKYAPKAGWIVGPSVTLELSADDIADMEARCEETMTEAPDYPGMWM